MNRSDGAMNTVGKRDAGVRNGTASCETIDLWRERHRSLHVWSGGSVARDSRAPRRLDSRSAGDVRGAGEGICANE